MHCNAIVIVDIICVVLSPLLLLSSLSFVTSCKCMSQVCIFLLFLNLLLSHSVCYHDDQYI